MRDELRGDRGNGRLSDTAEREVRELQSSTHPRQTLSPSAELELVEERTALADEDMRRTMRDGSVHPKSYNGAADLSDPVADDRGRLVDVEGDSGAIGVDLGDTNRDFFTGGLPELDDLTTGIDDVGTLEGL